jgi:toxin ParE1/3/4
MQIRWTDLAAADITQIADYLERQGSFDAAARIVTSTIERIEKLPAFPQQGRNGRRPGTRELVLTGSPYIAVYRISKDIIEILRILHGAQIWP